MQAFFLSFFSNKNFLKIFLLSIFAFLIPRFLPLYAPVDVEKDHNLFKFGLENLSDSLIEFLRYGNEGLPFNIALVNNKMATNQAGKSSASSLLKKGILLKYIFSKDCKLKKYINSVQELPLENLENFDLKNIDIFIFDMQNSGVLDKVADYLYKLLEICLKNKKKLIVFDRPNPLGPLVEGPCSGSFSKFARTLRQAQGERPLMVSSSNHMSEFWGPCKDLPFRNSLTIGELAKYFNFYNFHNQIDLQVVPMTNYLRSNKLYDLVQYKDNKLNKAKTYLCKNICKLLGQIEPFFVGVGSSKPFQCIMLPRLNIEQRKWNELKNILNKRFGIDSFYCSYFDKLENAYYVGLRLEVNNIEISIQDVVLTILNFFEKLNVNFKMPKNISLKSEINKNNQTKLANFINNIKRIQIYKPSSTPILIN